MHRRAAYQQCHSEASSQVQAGQAPRLRKALQDFLDRHGHPSIVGAEMAEYLDGDDGPGGDRLARMLSVCGFDHDAPGFVAHLESLFESGEVVDWRSVKVNGVPMPHALLLAVLEAIEPGDRLIDITSVSQLEKLIRRPVPPAERGSMQEVLDRYPVRLSQHSLRQLRLSSAVGCQYLPFVDELDREGLVNTWVGQFHSGVIERMYHNRVIMVLNMSCPVYCRFCFRKHKKCRQEPPPTRRDVVRGVEYVRASPGITEVVLTGGDPFMNRATLSCAVEGLLDVPQVQVLRLATRSVSYHPALFSQRDGFWMEYLKNARQKADRRGKRIEIAAHFIHPDELSVRSLDLIAELVSSGIPVYVQTPLLGKVNDTGPELVELYRRLRAAGAEMHYVFMPCSPLQGNRAYRSTVDDGMRLAAYLRAHLPDRAMPRFCTATAFGKIDWGPTGWVVEEDPHDPRYLWLRTPYTEQTFAAFAPGLDLGEVARRNAEGTLDARFMVDLGDRRWLRGPRARAINRSLEEECARVDVQDRISAYAANEHSGALAGDEVVRRVHSTRAELDIARVQDDLMAAIDGLRTWAQVSDVVVFSSEVDPLLEPARLRRTIDRLSTVPHVTAVRIRSRQAVVAPSGIRRRTLNVLAQGNRMGAAAPVRVELELRVLHHSELTTAHRHLAALLRAHGVSVYATTPMLAGVNDGADQILALSSRCRLYGIELHHLVVAGEPAQRIWNKNHPISTSLIIDIASELRRRGSGRELPRYVIQTAVGEVDLGLTAEVVGNDGGGGTRLRLLPFVVSDGCAVEPWGELPDPIEADQDGHPIVTVPGLTL